MASFPDVLSPLQEQLLQAFRGRDDVWLTGGIALGAFHLGHRRSEDLDWFTSNARQIELLSRQLGAFCEQADLELRSVQASPGFHRYQVRDPSSGDQTVVDLVHEPVPQVVLPEAKPVFDGIHVDPVEEIVANKLAALVGRGETKDLVDLYVLERSGVDAVAALEQAHGKDGAVEPATLAWVLTSVPTDPGHLLLVHPIAPSDLRVYRDDLSRRLLAAAWPP